MRGDSSEAAANHSSASSGGNAPDEREGSGVVAPGRDSAEGVLQPDVSFGAEPRMHVLQTVVVSAGVLASIGLLLAYIPLDREPGQPQHLGLTSAPWLAILLPFIAASVIGAAFHIYCVLVRKRAIEMQLGPPPDPETTVGGAILQHSILSRVFMKQYVASNISDSILFIGMAASVAVCLGYVLSDSLPVWRVVVLPFAAAGIASLVLHTMYRIRGRGALPSVSTRIDFMVVFAYLLAYKLDSDASLSWTVTFIFGFWWVSVPILIGVCALMVYLSGRRARIWQAAGLRVRAANAAAHLAAVLLLAALILLLAFMRSGHDLRAPSSVRRLRGSLGCVAAWVAASSAAHVVVWVAQHEREALRRQQIADGRVWTAVYNSLSSSATIARQVDSLSPEEIAQKATQMMAGVQKPARLFRLDVNLWSTERRAQVVPTSPAGVAPDTGTLAVKTDATLEPEDKESAASPTRQGAVVVQPVETEAGGAAAGEVALAVASGSEAADGGECSCVICYDGAADHVVLPCGHGGYCRACAVKVFVRPPSQCPVCRERLKAVVQVSLDTPIGEFSAIS
eukprot:jgi/Ulvmu1/2205/UM013_0051.1